MQKRVAAIVATDMVVEYIPKGAPLEQVSLLVTKIWNERNPSMSGTTSTFLWRADMKNSFL